MNKKIKPRNEARTVKKSNVFLIAIYETRLIVCHPDQGKYGPVRGKWLGYFRF